MGFYFFVFKGEIKLNINDLLIYGRKYLLDTQIENIPLKVRLLLEHVLKMNKFELVINHTQEISNEKVEEFQKGLEKIKNNTPIQYIINNQEFMKLNFYVDENVLIPQPDTEILVEEVIKYINNTNINTFSNTTASNIPNTSPIKILDLCTGSGAIAISLAKYIENCEITATDISNKAMQVAKLNAETNLVHKKINFIQSDMFENVDIKDFDIIVSNPPYIETDTIITLNADVQKEPKIALDGGIDGLNFYRIILNNGYNYLKNNGKLFLEIGYNQREKLFKLISDSNFFENPHCVKDLSGNSRVIICSKK